MANGEGPGNGGDGNGHGNGRERLDSWKAIAAYLGRDEATLRRWENTRGLPVRRLPGKRGASVHAYRDEIDAWLLTGQASTSAAELPQQPPPPDASPALPRSPASKARVAAGFLLIAAAAAAAMYFPSRSEAIAEGVQVEVTEAAVLARDVDNRRLWLHAFEDTHRHVLSQLNASARLSRTAPTTVFAATAIRFRKSDNGVEGGRLTAVDARGGFRWRFEFDDAVSLGGRTYDGPWGVEGFAIQEDPPRRIAVTAHHYTWSPSIVAVLDDTGRRLMRYVSDGWIERVHWVTASRLAVSGYSEARDGGMIALLDTTRVDAQAPETGAHRCSNCGGDQPLKVIVLPRSEVNRVTASRFNRALAEFVGGRLIARTEEMPSPSQGPAEALYEFDADLKLVRANYSDRYWRVHDQLFAAGTLDHDRARCPYRDGPDTYQSWSAETGWQTVTVPR